MVRRSRVGPSISDLFCNNYVISEVRSSYILLPGITDEAMQEGKMPFLQHNARNGCLTKFDDTIAYRVRHRFVKSLRKRQDNVCALFADLHMIFTEDAIKRCFANPNVWLLNHNAHAKRLRATEEHAENRMRKLDPEGYALHMQVQNRTSNRSARQHAVEERGLR